MSYDIYLVIDTGGPAPALVAEIGNYTSNVVPMWAKALGFPLADLHERNAGDCINRLKSAVLEMKNNWAEFEELNPSNGWGDALGACSYLTELAEACEKHPKATIEISH